MDALETLIAARDLLCDVTPLTFDCGTLCGAACCKSDDSEDEVAGMLLFPGEEELYADHPDFCQIIPSGLMHMGKSVPLMTCTGRCPRERRPLACRICPLIPRVKNNKFRLVMDIRATMCPLVSSGVMGLDPHFVETVEKAMQLLWDEPTHRSYLITLSHHIDEYRYLLSRFRGEN